MKRFYKSLGICLVCLMSFDSQAIILPFDADSVRYDRRGNPQYKYDEPQKKEIEKDLSNYWMPDLKNRIKERRGTDYTKSMAEIKTIEDSIRKTYYQEKYWEVMVTELSSMQKNLGKPITTEKEKEIIESIITGNDLSTSTFSTFLLGREDWYLWDKLDHRKYKKLKTERENKASDIQIIEKDLSNGIISKKLGSVIKDYLKRAKIISEYGNSYINSGYFNILNMELETQKNRLAKDTDNEIVLYDTIPNPYYADRLFVAFKRGDFDNSDISADDLETIKKIIWKVNRKPLDEGWEAPDNLFQMKSFSCFHGNRRSTSGKAAFNSRGELIRIVEPYLWSPYFQDFEYYDPRAVGFYQIAYKNNEYDIHSAGKDVNHYIKIQTDLEGLTAAEEAAQDRAAEKMAGALVGSMTDNMKYGNTKKGREAQRKRAADFVGGISQGTLKGLSGLNWLNQIQEDYWDRYIQRGPYLVERIDNTSFRLEYADDDLTPAFEMIIKYSSPVPFEVQDIIIVKEL